MCSAGVWPPVDEWLGGCVPPTWLWQESSDRAVFVSDEEVLSVPEAFELTD